MLTVENLVVRYGPATALKGISLEVRAGEIVTVLGANGAGKSTLLKTVSGLLRPRKGCIRLDGRRIDGLPPHAVVAAGVVQSPEGRHVFPDLTVRENLDLGGYLVRDPGRLQESLERAYRYFPVLRDRPDQKAGTLSGGEQQMLAVARALMTKPRLLMLDEPSLGLAPRMIDQIFEIVRRINGEEGATILLVEQNANEALRHADRGYVLENGHVTIEGTAAELRDNPAVRQAYLGL